MRKILSTLKLKNDARILFKAMKLFLRKTCSSTSCRAWFFASLRHIFYVSPFISPELSRCKTKKKKKKKKKVERKGRGDTTLSSSANLMNLAPGHFICETWVVLLEMIILKVWRGWEINFYRNLTENRSRKKVINLYYLE